VDVQLACQKRSASISNRKELQPVSCVEQPYDVVLVQVHLVASLENSAWNCNF
jgi:hypothetical protein